MQIGQNARAGAAVGYCLGVSGHAAWSGLVLAVTVHVAGSTIPQAHAADEQCLRFYEHANFTGRQWAWCGGQSPDYSWNDQVSSIAVPPGRRLTAYEHSQQRGRSKVFVGDVSFVGADFNDIISAWSMAAIDTSDCVTAYEHAGYGGLSWSFCPASVGVPTPALSEWNDKISSVRVPDGHQATFCVDLTHENGSPKGQTLCRTYFKDESWIGTTLNDKFSFVQWGPFNDDQFVMAVMSDPQYYFCESDACKNGPKSSEVANQWHSASILKLAESTPNFAGVIVNGDITNTEYPHQLENFKNDYEKKLFNLYIGLGNHDYDNYYGSACQGEGNAIAVNYCTRQMLTYLDEHINSIPSVGFDLTKDSWTRTGSYSYTWDIGDYRFIQLQNYPAWEVDFWVYVSSRVGNENFKITKSMDWLAKQLAATPSTKQVIINMHGMDSAMFNSSGKSTPASDKKRDDYTESERSATTAADYAAFQAGLDAHPNVRAIFTGHLHERIGKYGSVTTPTGKSIPVFFTGAAEYNRYLKVEFGKSNLVVQAIDSTNGETTLYQPAEVVTY